MLCMAFVLLKFPKCAICITSSQKEIFKMYLLDAKITINSPERKKKKENGLQQECRGETA